MRASGAVLFFLGLMMVYVGIYGLTIPTLGKLQLTTGFVDEFDDGIIGSQWTQFIYDKDNLGGVTVTESDGAINIYIPYRSQAGGLETVEKYVLGSGTVIDTQIRSLGSPLLASAVFAFGPQTHETTVYRMIYTQGGSFIVRKMFSSTPGDRIDLYTGTFTGMNPRVVITGTTVAFYNGANEVASETYGWQSWNCKFWIWMGSSSAPIDSTGTWERFAADLGAAPPQRYSLTSSVNPSTGGAVVRNPDQADYEEGSSVECTYYPATDYTFDNWEEDGVNVGTANPYTITMDANKALVAFCHYTGNGQEYAYLTVHCQEDMDGDSSWNPVPNLSVDILQGATLISTIVTDTNGIATKVDLAPGAYTISASYSGKSDSESVSLNVGSNPTVNLYFSDGTSPPPDDGILEWLKQLLDDPFVRTLSLWGGVAFCGIGVIVMASGNGKRDEQVFPVPSWI